MPSQVVKELEEIGNWKVVDYNLLQNSCASSVQLCHIQQLCYSLQLESTGSTIWDGTCLQARSAAVDKLYSALQKVQDKDMLLPTLSKLLRFLAILGEDANFKISLSTMQILADLSLKLGQDIRPYLG